MGSSLKLTFGLGGDASGDDSVIIEQDPWESTASILTRGQFLQSLYHIYGISDTPGSVSCGVGYSDGSPYVESQLRVFPGRIRSYTFKTSYGTLSNRVIDDFELEEFMSFSGTSEGDTKYYSDRVFTLEWDGDVFDSEGNRITPPVLTHRGDKVVSDSAAYGQVYIKYLVDRHSYQLRAVARENSDEDVFGAVVYALYDEGISWLELDAPPDADSLASGDSTCGYGGTGGYASDGSDDDAPEEAPGVDKTIVIDYCTQEILSETDSYV